MRLTDQLAGAMGLASWRARYALLEFASASPAAFVLAGKPSAYVKTPGVLGLNEVGVTDSVMTTLWQCSPLGWAAATTTASERNHFGADIAFVDQRRRRLLLYQAKLGRLDRGDSHFRLKSKVTKNQIRLLTKSNVQVRGFKYGIAGRLAVFQIDHTPSMPPGSNLPLSHPLLLSPNDALQYFDNLLGPHLLSPSGVLAAPVPASVTRRVPVVTTMPWEFDTNRWIAYVRHKDDDPPPWWWPEDDEQPRRHDWHRDRFEYDEEQYPDVDVDFATQLHRALGLPKRRQLHVMFV